MVHVRHLCLSFHVRGFDLGNGKCRRVMHFPDTMVECKYICLFAGPVFQVCKLKYSQAEGCMPSVPVVTIAKISTLLGCVHSESHQDDKASPNLVLR